MSDTPRYVGLLNALAISETIAHDFLEAWIAVTPDDGVRATLELISIREGEHGMALAKRVIDLGYPLEKRDDPGSVKRLEIAGSDLSDLEKMEALNLQRYFSDDTPDFFDTVFADHSIDPQTGALLGRHIAEERDTGRRLKALYEQLRAQAGHLATTDA